MICNFEEDYWLVTKEYFLVVLFVISMQRKGIKCHICLWCRGTTVLWTVDLLSIEKATSWETSVSLDVTQLLFPTKITANERMDKSLAGNTLPELFLLCWAYGSIICHHLDQYQFILLKQREYYLVSKCSWDTNNSHG